MDCHFIETYNYFQVICNNLYDIDILYRISFSYFQHLFRCLSPYYIYEVPSANFRLQSRSIINESPHMYTPLSANFRVRSRFKGCPDSRPTLGPEHHSEIPVKVSTFRSRLQVRKRSSTKYQPPNANFRLRSRPASHLGSRPLRINCVHKIPVIVSGFRGGFKVHRSKGRRLLIPLQDDCTRSGLQALVSPASDAGSCVQDQHVEQVITPDQRITNTSTCLTAGMLNVRSLRNKATDIHELIVDKKLDMFFVTETWLHVSDVDRPTVCKALPHGYDFMHCPRLDDSGYGGVGVIYRNTLRLKKCTVNAFSTFELMLMSLNYESRSMLIALVYRPPPSAKNQLSSNAFVDQLDELLHQLFVLEKKPVLLLGDFNLHFDDESNVLSSKVRDLLSAVNVAQYVKSSTHTHGHILDLLISQSGVVSDVLVEDPLLSDHSAVLFKLTSVKNTNQNSFESIAFRNLKAINLQDFKADLSASLLSIREQVSPAAHLQDLNRCFEATLDKHAPIIHKRACNKSKCLWMTDELKSARCLRRKLERQWRASGSTSQKDRYQRQRNHVKKLIFDAKRQFYDRTLETSSNKTKTIFKLFKSWTTTATKLPERDSNDALANEFQQFFINKVKSISESFATSQVRDSRQRSLHLQWELSSFVPVDTPEVVEVLTASPESTCSLDILPTNLLKQCKVEIAETLTQIFNTSLSSGIVPDCWKKAIVRPLLKKSTLDHQVLSNYRPVSNLPFLSKVLERIVAKQLKHYLVHNNLFDKFQSAYRKFHSTETLLMRLHDDILYNLDQNRCTFLLMLDLSAAFDTLDHGILLDRLTNKVGITGLAFTWLKSYLSGRSQTVQICDAVSTPASLTVGVPQGSVLGPLLFCLYMLPMSDVFAESNVSYQLFADDSQFYIAASREDVDGGLQRLESCAGAVSKWMVENHLQLNANKSELIIFHPRRVALPQPLGITVGSCAVLNRNTVKNLGVKMEASLSVTPQVNALCQVLSFHLRQIYCIKRYLSDSSLKSIISAIFTSRLDYGNATLFGAPAYEISRLQRLQNSAARLIRNKTRRCHITPVLMELHWLPVEARISFKMAMTVYKAVHGMSPAYINDLIKQYEPKRVLRSASNGIQLAPVSSRTKRYGDRRFSVAAPKIWNALPREVRSSDDISSFKSKLKTFYFRKWFFDL